MALINWAWKKLNDPITFPHYWEYLLVTALSIGIARLL